MTKLDYYNEWMKQVITRFNLPEDTTIQNLKEKCSNEEQYKEAVHFEANFNSKSYRCYMVEIKGQKMVMLCLVDDRKLVDEDEFINTIHYGTYKVDDEFELADKEFFRNYSFTKVDLNKVVYLMCSDEARWKTVMEKKEVKHVVANELRLAHYVRYNSEYDNLEVAPFRSIANTPGKDVLKYNVDFTYKETLFSAFPNARFELANLQYYSIREILDNKMMKYKNSLNTLQKGDIGYDELGKTENGITYSISNSYVRLKTSSNSRNFFDTDVICEDLNLHGSDYCVIYDYANFEEFKASKDYTELETLITNKKLIDSIDDYNKMLNRAFQVVVLIFGANMMIYSQTEMRDTVEVFRYTANFVNDIFEETVKVISHLKKTNEEDVLKERQRLIDICKSSKKKIMQDTVDNYVVKYSYDVKHNWLVCEDIDTEDVNITIPAVFDATKPFFKSDIEFLDFNNVQYILDKKGGFNRMSNLKEVKGEKLRLTYMIDANRDCICNKNRKCDELLCLSVEAYSNHSTEYINERIESMPWSFAILDRDKESVNFIDSHITFFINDFLFFTNKRCRVCFPSLQFFFFEYSEWGKFDFNKVAFHIKAGEIGYEEQNNYRCEYERKMYRRQEEHERWNACGYDDDTYGNDYDDLGDSDD